MNGSERSAGNLSHHLQRAQTKYLSRYAEPLAAELVELTWPVKWQHTLVIPAFRESATLLDRIANSSTGGESLIVILVVNRPDRGSSAKDNHDLLHAVKSLEEYWVYDSGVARLAAVSPLIDLLCIDRDGIGALIPRSQGVGLARKLGADIAAALIAAQIVSSPWIHCTDADAKLPADYYQRVYDVTAKSPAALVHPFIHCSCKGGEPGVATQVYDAFLRQYPCELELAGSPYGYHTLGSCLSAHSAHYCAVRGFPRRSAAEDFYLLNKLAKTGSVELTAGEPIRITERISDRVPFGTGPAVEKLSQSPDPRKELLFYHPDCYTALRRWLQSWPALYALGQVPSSDQMLELLEDTDAKSTPAQWILPAQIAVALRQLKVESAIAHSLRQSSDYAGFERQMHTWFDGFRTLKLIRMLPLPRLSYNDL